MARGAKQWQSISMLPERRSGANPAASVAGSRRWAEGEATLLAIVIVGPKEKVAEFKEKGRRGRAVRTAATSLITGRVRGHLATGPNLVLGGQCKR